MLINKLLGDVVVRRFLILCFLACYGCSTPTIPTGSYEMTWALELKVDRYEVLAELIVLPNPIELTAFHPETWIFGTHFGTQPDQSICVITRFPVQDEDGRQLTSLTLSRPELVDGMWKIRLLENHHYWSWLAINTGSNELKGSFHATGYGGPTYADVQISRIGAFP